MAEGIDVEAVVLLVVIADVEVLVEAVPVLLKWPGMLFAIS